MQPTDPAEIVHLKPIEIWYLYKTKILIYGGSILAALTVFAGVQLYRHQRTTGSQELFAAANSAAELQAVIQKYPETVAAGNASLKLAEQLRAEKKYDEAVTVLRNFVEKNPEHPLAPGGWTSLGITYEVQGKLDEALEANQQGISKYPESEVTPVAMLAQARIYSAKGKKEEARRVYMDIVARYNRSIYAGKAQRELHFLRQ